jgi:hypothetical protein
VSKLESEPPAGNCGERERAENTRNDPGGDRTHGPVIKSHMLYH